MVVWAWDELSTPPNILEEHGKAICWVSKYRLCFLKDDHGYHWCLCSDRWEYHLGESQRKTPLSVNCKRFYPGGCLFIITVDKGSVGFCQHQTYSTRSVNEILILHQTVWALFLTSRYPIDLISIHLQNHSQVHTQLNRCMFRKFKMLQESVRKLLQIYLIIRSMRFTYQHYMNFVFINFY